MSTFEEGQEFVVAGFEKPEGFCDWAWNDIYRFVVFLLSGGNFSKDHFEGGKIFNFVPLKS